MVVCSGDVMVEEEAMARGLGEASMFDYVNRLPLLLHEILSHGSTHGPSLGLTTDDECMP